MKHRAAWTLGTLAGTAAAAWGAVITLDAANIRTHAEHDLLGVACIATACGIIAPFFFRLFRLIEDMNKANKELARAVATRPLNQETTGPIPLLPRRAAAASNGRRPAHHAKR